MILQHAQDPFNSLVFFSDSLFDERAQETDLLKFYVATTIERPTLMYEIKDFAHKRYYFRAVCWHKTLLVEVQQDNGMWNVKKCYQDPGGIAMLEIYRMAKQLI
ncbi:hypothetical protein [Longitalea arenae]|uniref:hypothetical protein n=1 Tax=Longitalea arenae TaxID=2812558 RepID=UPI0019684D62|nr:hypothetical protein [Longitalea arenae]